MLTSCSFFVPEIYMTNKTLINNLTIAKKNKFVLCWNYPSYPSYGGIYYTSTISKGYADAIPIKHTKMTQEATGYGYAWHPSQSK